MSIYKDKNGSWYTKFRYKDWQGNVKWITKRGFGTKREASQWEREFLLQKSNDMSMCFSDFIKIYESDIGPRLKRSTFECKHHIIETKLLPYFGKKKVCDITAADIVQWQNLLLTHLDPSTGKRYSSSYLKTIHNQLSAVLNHAVRFYGLQKNEARTAGNMGSEKGIVMKFWTKEEYLRFADAMMDDPKAYYCFEVLYWCGIREGELLALTSDDIDFKSSTISISKTYHRIKGEDVITDPKTPKSRRIVEMPEFIRDELCDYFSMCPNLASTDRIFPVTKEYLLRRMISGSEKAGVKRIRIHDLRHSHVSLLINMGFSALEIAERVGHESIDITYRYAHLFPNTQKTMANRLHLERGN